MMSMMGGQGMGSAGTGVGSAPMMPGGPNAAAGGLSPQMLAALMQGMQGAGATGQPMGQPMGQAPAQSAMATPMAGYIGAGAGGAGHAMPMQMSPQTPIQGMGGQGGGAAPAGMGINPQTMAMLQMLKGGQAGVPSGGAMPGAGVGNLMQGNNLQGYGLSSGIAQNPQLQQYLLNGGAPGAGLSGSA